KIAYSASNSVVSLAEGMPNEETFPFKEISIKLNDGSSFTLDGQELGAALQYIPTQGYPPLLQSLREFQRRAHAPPLWESRDIMIVSGAQDGLSKTFEAILGPGDSLLVHDPFYPGVQVVVSNSQAVFQLCHDCLDSPRLNYRAGRSEVLVKQKELLALSFVIFTPRPTLMAAE
ncbi:unnamed protein product, partial [Heterotrigona itama]